MNKKIRAIIRNVDEDYKIVEIEDKLETYQRIVGGYIECVSIPHTKIDIIINEEGKLEGLEPNIMCDYDVLVGNVLFVGVNYSTGDFRSLTNDEIDIVKKFLGERSIWNMVV